MTERELELFSLLVSYAASLDDACPDVGMGPSIPSLAEDVARQLTFTVSSSDLAVAVARVQAKRQRSRR